MQPAQRIFTRFDGAFFLAALAGIACSGSAPSAGEKPDPGEEYVKIDDMEGSTHQIEWTPEDPPPDAVPGLWMSYVDDQCENLDPLPTTSGVDRWSFSVLPESHETLPGVESRHAARLRTLDPLVNTWGAGMGFDLLSLLPDAGAGGGDPGLFPCPPFSRELVELPTEPVDLTSYAGVTFWGRASGRATQLLVIIQDQDTDPRGGICDPVVRSAEECWNGFSLSVELTEEFARYSIDFSDLAQDPQWGYRPVPSVLDLEHVYGIVFQVNTPGGECEVESECLGGLPELSFDVWIDDLYLIER